MEQWRDELEGMLGAETLRKRDYPMKKLTTLRVGGPADLYIEPSGEEELKRILSYCSERKIPSFLLGRGSNLLVRDGGIRGVVYSLRHAWFSEVGLKGKRLLIQAGAGATVRRISQFAQGEGLAGLEFLEGIPGSLGGGLKMNAGAYKSCLFDVVESVKVMSPGGEISEVEGKEIPFTYRSCPFFEDKIALSAVLRVYAGAADQIRETMLKMREKRLESQTQSPSAGCAFKNPPGLSAGQLIDGLGLKGETVGGAQVSERHANFLINKNNATARDVLELIELIREKVWEQHQIRLETEVIIVGQDPES